MVYIHILRQYNSEQTHTHKIQQRLLVVTNLMCLEPLFELILNAEVSQAFSNGSR